MEDTNDNSDNIAIDEETYEDVMDKQTFSRNRIKIMICMVFLFIADGVEMCFFGLTIIPFGSYFNVEETSVEIQFASSAIFIGIMIGSAIASLLTKKVGRIITINSSNFVFFITFLIKSIWLNIPLYIICEILSGIALGIIIPIFMNVYGEYLPDKYRGLLLMVAWSFFGIGELIMCLITLAVMPELQKDKLQEYLLILSIFPFLQFVSCLICLRDSPKGISLAKKLKEKKNPLILLNNVNQAPTDNEQDENSEKITKENDESYSTKEIIKEMFSPGLKKTTILLIFIFIFLGYNAFGIYSIAAYFLEYLDEKESDKEEEESIPARDIIINQLLYSVADFGSNVIGGFIGEIRILGRKGGIIIFSILAGVLTVIGLFKKILFQITSPIVSGCTNIYVNLIMDYVVELYPTKIRDTSTSSLFLIYRISCASCNFISIGFYDIHKFIPYIIYTIFAILSTLFTWALPYEMAGKSMK